MTVSRVSVILALSLLAFTDLAFGAVRHSLREMVQYDSAKMVSLVNKEINSKEKNDEIYLNDVSRALAQTVLVQPHFNEREAGLREIRGKLEQSDYFEAFKRAAAFLLPTAKSSNAADQATVLVALVNLVDEIKGMKAPELKPLLEKIAKADIEVSDAARTYAREPLQNLTSPSSEAQEALKSL